MKSITKDPNRDCHPKSETHEKPFLPHSRQQECRCKGGKEPVFLQHKDKIHQVLPRDEISYCHYGEKVGACLLAKPKRLPEGGHEHPKGAHRGPAGHHREGEEEEEWVGEHLPDKDLTKAGKPELATDNKAAFVAFLANLILTFVSSCQWPGSNNFFAIFPVLFT